MSAGSGSRQPIASVVVAARNAAATIDRCLDSLEGLDYPRDRLELIVVDNGSSDDTPRRVAERDGEVTLLSERRPGSAAARNAGTRAAAGEIVAFTDADCVAEPAWLRLMVEPLSDPGVGIACGEVLALEPSGAAERLGESIHDTRMAIEVYRPPYAVTSNWASRRQVLLDLGGFDEEMLRGQDTDLSYRAVSAGLRLVYVPGAVIRHRNERTLTGLLRQGYRHGRYGRRIERKHRALLDSYGHGRLRPPALSTIAEDLRGALSGPDRRRSLASAAFASGKRLGMGIGSLIERPPPHAVER